MQNKSCPSSGLWDEATSMVAEPANRLSLPTWSTSASVTAFQHKQSPCTWAPVMTKTIPLMAQVDVPHLATVVEAGEASSVGARLV